MKVEHFDPKDVLEEKIEKLAFLVKSSSHMIGFTGAGISTSAGIPDYRSTHDTVLDTGPGQWEAVGQGGSFESFVSKPSQFRKVQTVEALPTFSHMALSTLMDQGHLKYLISQNIDGLHRKSGIPVDSIAELHGNTNLEICQSCGKDYLRDFRTRNQKVFDNHLTGRKCDNKECNGDLFDTIVNFGEGINKALLTRASEESKKSDLCLCLGSSLLVKPAMYLP